MNSFKYIVANEYGFKDAYFDYLLASGFYRMQHMMFTCNETITGNDDQYIPVFWLRTVLQKCKLHKSAKTILKKCAGYTVIIQQAYVDDEIENLYAEYKKHVAFTVSKSCADYLHHELLPQPFDSMMVQVYDDEQLIATGYFDKSNNAIAGIMNIYHPSYRQYSLGKFLILQKLQYALSQNMLFYYTGYISTESTRFDYKTFPDVEAVEVLLPIEQKWVPYHTFNKTFLAEYYEQYLEEK